MRFDVVTWVKDGEWCLPYTLKRLEDVLPSHFVHRKIMVDDHSVDGTKEVGEFFGWEVYDNPSGGISAGANFALGKVDCQFFMSFEQDIYLADNWFDKINVLFEDSMVAVGSGVRLANQPKYLRLFERYLLCHYQDKPLWSDSGFRCGKFLDQTMWRTDVVRKLGGFPNLNCNTGVDTVLSYLLLNFGLRWVVDKSVVSIHLRRNGASDAIRHQFWYASGFREIKERIKRMTGLTLPETYFKLLLRLGFSPFRGVQIGLDVDDPRVVVLYPLLRLANCLGYWG